MKKIPATAVLLIVLIIILVITISEKNKKEDILQSSKKPERIVTLAPNLTEIVFELGLGPRVAAVTSDSDFPAEAKSKVKIGNFWRPDIEAIIAAKPDLILALPSEHQIEITENLRQSGYQVLRVKLETIEELKSGICDIGKAASCQEQANKLAEKIEQQINSIKEKNIHKKKPKVLWVVQAEPLRVAGVNTFLNDIIELAGGRNAVGETIQQYPSLSYEQLLAAAPEVIIHSTMTTGAIEKEQEAARSFWSKHESLPAVKSGRIYAVDSDVTLRLGPRLPEGVKTIADLLHPPADFNTKE
jgi:iron complex transport system substrate-binding protein